MVSKEWIHPRFFLRVWVKPPAHPLPSSSRAKAGELWIPRNLSSLWNMSERSALPWPWLSDRSVATPPHIRQSVLVCRGGSLRVLRNGRILCGVDPDTFGPHFSSRTQSTDHPGSTPTFFAGSSIGRTSVGRMFQQLKPGNRIVWVFRRKMESTVPRMLVFRFISRTLYLPP